MAPYSPVVGAAPRVGREVMAPRLPVAEVVARWELLAWAQGWFAEAK